VSKEEIIAAVQKCAVKLERTPRLEDLRAANINSYKVRMRFGNYMRLLAEAGLDATGMGHPVEQRALFLDWAGIVRKMKKIPTIVQYEQQSKYSVRPLAGRYQGWRKVAAGMHDYVIENHPGSRVGRRYEGDNGAPESSGEKQHVQKDFGFDFQTIDCGWPTCLWPTATGSTHGVRTYQ